MFTDESETKLEKKASSFLVDSAVNTRLFNWRIVPLVKILGSDECEKHGTGCCVDRFDFYYLIEIDFK